MIKTTKLFHPSTCLLICFYCLIYCLIVFGAHWFTTPESFGQTIPSQPCAQQTILFVAGTRTPSTVDQPLVAYLSTLGYQVDIRSSQEVQASDANGKNLVVISGTAKPNELRTRLRDIPVAILTWEGWILDDLQMTGADENTDFGKLNQSTITLSDPQHPIAGGLSGSVQTTSSKEDFHWGKPAANAQIIAVADRPSRAYLFAYEQGAAMVGLTAPAKRVFIHNATGTKLTANGWALFEAAVRWASNCTAGEVPVSPETPAATATPLASPTTAPGATEQLSITKRDFLFTDADSDNLVSAGDTVYYAINIVNQGAQTTPSLRLADRPDANTSLVTGSVRVIGGVIVQGNHAGDGEAIVDITPLISGANASISLQVVVNAQLSVTELQNQALVTILNPNGQPSGQPALVSDDPDTSTPNDATVTPLTEPADQIRPALFLPLIYRE